MNYNEVITLLKVTKTTSDTGDIVEVIERNEIFAKYNSVGMKETYTALSLGLKPEISFTIADYYDYDGQDSLEYNGERWRILRTYRKATNELEIVVTKYADA